MGIRKFRSISLLLTITFLTCCGVSNNPKDVAEHFINASVNMNFEEAKKYATPEAAKMLDFVQNISSKAHSNVNALKDLKIELGDESITGDNATVKYKKAGSKEEYYISMKRINGKWLVATSMGDLSGDADLKAGEEDIPADSSGNNKVEQAEK